MEKLLTSVVSTNLSIGLVIELDHILELRSTFIFSAKDTLIKIKSLTRYPLSFFGRNSKTLVDLFTDSKYLDWAIQSGHPLPPPEEPATPPRWTHMAA